MGGGEGTGMNFFIPVRDYPSGKALIPPLSARQFSDRVFDGLTRDASPIRAMVSSTVRGAVFRGETVRVTEDRGNARQAGWTYILHKDDPQRDRLIRALAPLARHRGMDDPQRPLLFEDGAAE